MAFMELTTLYPEGLAAGYVGDESLELFDLLNTTDLLLGNHSDNNDSVATPDVSRIQLTQGCKIFKFTLYTVAMGILCTMGFAGNTLSFLVLRKDLSTPVASFLLETLAMADNVLLVLWIIHYSLRESIKFFGLMAYVHDAWIYTRVYTFPVMYMAQTATIWLTVVIALNRYMAVCLPYRAPHLCNINNVYKGVASVILFSIAYNLPRFFEIQIIYVPAANGMWEMSWKRTMLGKNKIYDQVYVDAFYYLFSFVLPLLTLAFVNTWVTVAYQAIRRRKRRLTSHRQENENNITLVMIIIVLIFMLCQAPARVVQIVWGYQYKYCQTYEFYLIHISNTLEVLNSSVNFLVYFMFRKRFRDIVYTHFCIGPLARLNRRESDRSPTTEGLSLVQIEQTTATIMQNETTHPAQNTPPHNYDKNDTSRGDQSEQQPLNGACTNIAADVSSQPPTIVPPTVDNTLDNNADTIDNIDEVRENGGFTENCIQHNNDDNSVIEDDQNVPLNP